MSRPDDEPVQAKVGRVAKRLALVSLVGPLIGVPWALVRGGNLGMYTLMVASNSMVATAPCFAFREVVGKQISEPIASTVSGALGGAIVLGYYAGIRGLPKGVLAFGFAGFALERTTMLIEDWRIKRREEIIQERQRVLGVSSKEN